MSRMSLDEEESWNRRFLLDRFYVLELGFTAGVRGDCHGNIGLFFHEIRSEVENYTDHGQIETHYVSARAR